MTTSIASPRQDFHDAAETFLALVAQVPDDAWDQPGLGVWTVRELVGHTCRALSTVEEYLAQPTSTVTLTDAVEYFRVGAAMGLTNTDAVAERGREAGRDLGPNPARAAAELAERVLQLVDVTADDAVVPTRLGAMRLIDYLPTRTFELSVHGMDLQGALGMPPSPPPGPLTSAVRIATELAVDQGLGPRLLLALTGRQPLPDGTCVL